MANHRYEVIGPRKIAGAAPGDTVMLDDDEFNIAALVEAGHVRPVSKAAKEAAKDD
jgi:hypothetical protein